MNLAIRGFAADLGQEPADTFASDQFPDQKFDYILANPPFNISEWGGEKYESDPLDFWPTSAEMPTMRGYSICSGNYALVVKQA